MILNVSGARASVKQGTVEVTMVMNKEQSHESVAALVLCEELDEAVMVME